MDVCPVLLVSFSKYSAKEKFGSGNSSGGDCVSLTGASSRNFPLLSLGQLDKVQDQFRYLKCSYLTPRVNSFSATTTRLSGAQLPKEGQIIPLWNYYATETPVTQELPFWNPKILGLSVYYSFTSICRRSFERRFCQASPPFAFTFTPSQNFKQNFIKLGVRVKGKGSGYWNDIFFAK